MSVEQLLPSNPSPVPAPIVYAKRVNKAAQHTAMQICYWVILLNAVEIETEIWGLACTENYEIS